MTRAARSYAADELEPIRPQPLDGLPLFAQPELRTLARREDPDTSKAAAVAISDSLTELQARVFAAFQQHGPMTAKQAEQLPEFADLGFSTVRKRISELSSRGQLRATGRIVEGCKEFEPKGDGDARLP